MITGRGAGSQFQTDFQILVGNDGDVFIPADTTPPLLVSARAPNPTQVDVAFNEAVTFATAENIANYEVFETARPASTITVTSATLAPGAQRTVALALSVSLQGGINYTARVNSVQDLAGNVIAPNSTAPFTFSHATVTPIASIQANPQGFQGQVVTVEGQVYIPTNYRNNVHSGYIQDDSGRGINLFGTGADDPLLTDTSNIVRVTGTVALFFTTVEILDITQVTLISGGNPPLQPAVLSTGSAASPSWEGTFIESTGPITAAARGGPGWNYTINDGTGPLVVRVVDDLVAPEFQVHQVITARGAGSQFSGQFLILVGSASAIEGAASPTTLRVPSDVPTIRAAAHQASEGDTVLVAPGTYSERFTVTGKNFVLRGEGGADVTVINGASTTGNVITLVDVDRTMVVEDVTVTGGMFHATHPESLGAGIYITQGAPTIQRCKLTSNESRSGAGVTATAFSAPLIRDCWIGNNTGGGIVIEQHDGLSVGARSEIIDNYIVRNTGFGVSVVEGAKADIQNCTIAYNGGDGVRSEFGSGGVGQSFVTVENTLITNNQGAGIIRRDVAVCFVLQCNDVWDNQLGQWVGSNPGDPCFTGRGAGSISIDPGYRNPELDDFRIASTSVLFVLCRPSACGTIGADDICGAAENEPPGCDAGGPYVVDCVGSVTTIELDGTGSSDPDGDVLSFHWSSDCPGTTLDDPTSATPVITIDTSCHCDVNCTVTLEVSDGVATTACTTDVSVFDETPPMLTVELNRNVLWPPNHRLSDIQATVEVLDACDSDPTFALVSITSNEPDNGLGDGGTVDDIQGADVGTADVTFQLRSERSGLGDGRTYTITYMATDASGNLADTVLCVTVPHDEAGTVLASSGFIAGGTELDPEAASFFMIVSSGFEGSIDAQRYVPSKAFVGNHLGVIPALSWRFVDRVGDQTRDLVLEYPTAVTLGLMEDSGIVPVGMRYEDRHGTGYVVSDILKLDLAVDAQAQRIPARSALLWIRPNPFNPSTQIGFDLAAREWVRIGVYDSRGALLRTLLQRHLPAGRHEVSWDGRDTSGRSVASGVYFFRLTTMELEQTMKAVLMK
jgi:hypothetical protein